jgi:AcrR family transcriptional regulator
VADVAREAGVGVGSVYLEFPSKEAIVEELSRSRYEAVLVAMRGAAEAEGLSWGARLTGALDARLRAYLSQAEGGAHACDLFHCANAAVKSASERFHEEERALVVGMLRAGHQAGEIEVADADLAARAILRAYKTFTPPWCFMGEREDTWRLAGAVHGIVLSGIVRRGKGKRGT